jgi:hypothetical protein
MNPYKPSTEEKILAAVLIVGVIVMIVWMFFLPEGTECINETYQNVTTIVCE